MSVANQQQSISETTVEELSLHHNQQQALDTDSQMTRMVALSCMVD